MEGDKVTIGTLTECIAEAKRFIARAEEAKKRIKQDGNGVDWISSSAETAAARRASMDLTRALSRMRRS